MLETPEQLMLRSPHLIRTVAANFMSWRLDRLRRGGDRLTRMQEYGQAQYRSLTWNEVRHVQDRRLSHLLHRAAEHTPYYKPLARDLTAIQSVEQINELPTLTKAQAREAGPRLYDEELLSQKHYTGHTSGTTGSPFTFKLTLEALRIRYALRDSYYALNGFDFDKQTNLRFGGRLFISTSQRKPPFWIYDHATNQLMFSLYHMSDSAFDHFLEPLLRHRPAFVTGYPSSIYLFSKFCLEQNIDWRPQGVFTDSETVLDHHRTTVSAAWGCEIHDSYGLEAGWLAGQCEHGKYHLSPLTSILEILNDDGKPAAPDELGEIVVTDLTNPLMPLIRYRTGDVAAWSESPCSCGWNTPTIDRIEGRVDDIVVLPDGRKIGRLDHVFKQAEHIQECQIVQETPNHFVFLVVPDSGYTQIIEHQILKEAYARLGDEVTITVKYVDAVERASGRKFRSVISYVE